MRKFLILTQLFAGMFGCAIPQTQHVTQTSPQEPPMNERALENSLQCLVVVTPGWDEVDGRLWRFERESTNQPWRRLQPEYAIVVGRSGLGWGQGLHSIPENAPYIKQEGDGRSPAGLFEMPSAFGFATPESASDVLLPYDHVTAGLMCVDDASSDYYNRIVHTDDVTKDWNSAEDMFAIGEDYHWGIVVAHNMYPVTPGAGSCIFIHNWRGPGNGTAGCTALEPAEMRDLVAWVDPAANPLFVQLPLSEYQRLQAEWGLPVIDADLLP